MRILITGGSGFIGTNLVEHYLSAGDEVLNLDIAPPRCSSHKELWRAIDLRDQNALSETVRGYMPELVMHMGARTDLDGQEIEDYSANTVGVKHLIHSLNRIDTVRRVIFASSRMVCPIGYQPKHDEDYAPPNTYGESKVQTEIIIRKMAPQVDFEWAIVRPTSIWGPWFDVPYKSFFNAVKKGLYFHPAKTKILKSFGYVGNTVFQLSELAKAEAPLIHGKTFYLADYEPVEIRKMAEQIRQALDAPPVRELPLGLLRVLGIGGDLLKRLGYRNPPLTSFRLDNLVTQMVYDLSATERIAKPLPYSIEEGIQATTDWLKRFEYVRQ